MHTHQNAEKIQVIGRSEDPTVIEAVVHVDNVFVFHGQLEDPPKTHIDTGVIAWVQALKHVGLPVHDLPNTEYVRSARFSPARVGNLFHSHLKSSKCLAVRVFLDGAGNGLPRVVDKFMILYILGERQSKRGALASEESFWK